MMYYQVLMAKNIDRELYLAIPYRAYKITFQNEIGQLLLQNDLLRLIVFDEDAEVLSNGYPAKLPRACKKNIAGNCQRQDLDSV